MAYKWKDKKKVAYVVFYGRVPGIYKTWAETQKQTNRYSGAQFIGFTSAAEAQEAWEDHLISLEEAAENDEDDFLLDMDDLDD